MPRTIFQHNEQTYIGDRIWFVSPLKPEHKHFTPVWDREVNDWIQLNVGDQQVDYVVSDVRDIDAVLTWVNEYDYQEIIVLLNAPGLAEKELRFPVSLSSAKLTGLQPETTYEINVLAETPWGPTLSNRQTFRTSRLLVPSAPSGFRFTQRTNDWIDLQWDRPHQGVADHYVVYRAVGNGRFSPIATTTNRFIRISRLKHDTRYRYIVRGVNADGRIGAASAQVRSATGHSEARKSGSARRVILPPLRWGSWRADIGWNWWYYWPEKDANVSIYQGYWRYPSTRYWGLIEYDDNNLRRILDSKFGSGVGSNFTVSSASIFKVYRQRMAGNYSPQQLEWHLTGSKVRGSNSTPSIFERHINDRNSPDSLSSQRAIRAGQAISMLRIPRSWGTAIIRGHRNNKNVTGIALQRGDNYNNGYGYAGYLKISGHKQPDWHLGSQGWRFSDLSLVVNGSWNFRTRSYKAPYTW